MAASGKSIYTALMDARKAMGPLVKDSTNPHFKNKYASLENVVDVIDGPLRDAGIAWVQHFETRDDGIMTLVTTFSNGEGIITSEMPIACKDPGNPQAVAGAITYYRRYALITMCGLTPEDDDGTTAAQKPQPKQINEEQVRTMHHNPHINLIDFVDVLKEAARLKDEVELRRLTNVAIDAGNSDAVAALVRHVPRDETANRIMEIARARGIDTKQASAAYIQRTEG